jgi:hypothetical protein
MGAEKAPPKPEWPKFVDAYLEAALWTATDEDGRPLDRKHSVSDFSQESVDDAVREGNKFIGENRADLESVGTESQHGHDFWLTRNRHGAGFWDRGYGAAGDRLTKSAHGYGEAYVYVGDDGALHIS